MKSFSKRIALGFAAVIFAANVFASSNAAALTCEKNTYSRAEIFLETDVVFSGIPLSEHPDGVVVKVTEWFKAPNAKYRKADKILVALNGRSTVIENREFIFYGYSRDTKAQYPVARTNVCLGASNYSADDIIERLNKWEKSPDELKEEIIEDNDLVFIGRVKQVNHEEKTRKALPAFKQPESFYIDSQIDFEITRLFKNDTRQKSLKAGDKVSIYAFQCGVRYEVGQSYLMFASSEKSARREERLRAQCTTLRQVINIDEKVRLRELAEKMWYQTK